MSTFKKLFASIAAVMIVVSTAPVAVFGQTSRSTEYQDAYAFAFANGITTMSSINGARLADTTTRAEFAKMASAYAENVLELTPNTSASCSFSDLAPVAGTDLADYAVKACQLGLMGIGTNGIFNPMGVLSRAEAFTVISRMFYGDTYNGGNPYYAAHMNALQQAGLVNDLSNPTRPIIRGDVMLVLKRSSEADLSVTPGFCSDIETVFACTIDPDGSMGLCPAACLGGNNNGGTDPVDQWEIKAGALNVSLNSATLANNSQIPSTGTVRFAAVDFSASSSDVALKTVEIEKLGLATIPPQTRVWFERNGVRITGRAAFTSEGKAILSFAPAFVVKSNSTESLDLYIELASNPGFDFQFRSAAMDTSALSVNGGFTTPVLRTVDYEVSTAAIASIAGVGVANVTTNGMEVGAFTVQANNPSAQTRDALFKSVTLRQNGTASLSNLGNIVLERDGQVVSTSYSINGRDLTISLNDEIKDATLATYYIKAIVNNVEQSTDNYQFELRNQSDINIVEKTTAFRMRVSPTSLPLDNYQIQGGDITFARDTSVDLANSVPAGSQNVILMKGTMKSNSAITVEDPFLTYAAGLDAAWFSGFSTIYMSIGSSTFSYSPAAGGSATGASFGGTATINGTVNVQVRGTFKTTAPAGSYRFQPLQLSSFKRAEYTSNGNTVASAIGSIEGVNVTVENTTLNVTRTDGLGSQTVAAGTNGLTVVKLNLSSNQGNGVRVSRAVFATGTTSALALNNTTLTLLVNGNAVSTKQLQGSSITFDFPSVTVSKNSPVTLEVRANLAEAFNAGQLHLALSSLTATDVGTSQAVTSYQQPASAIFMIGTANAEVTELSVPLEAALLLSPSTSQQILAFRVKALNDNVTLRDLEFQGSYLDNLSNFRLTTSTGVVFASASSNDGSDVVFTNITSPSIAKDQNATFYLIANVNNNVVYDSFDIELNSVNVRSSNGTVVAANMLDTPYAEHSIAENRFVVAKAANNSKSLQTSALRFTVTAEGKDSVYIDDVYFDALLAGYTGSNVYLQLYRNSISSSNFLDDASIDPNGTTSSSLNAGIRVDAGTTVTFILRVVGVAVNPNSNSQDWTITVTDIFESDAGYDASEFDNVGGNLPITESRFN